VKDDRGEVVELRCTYDPETKSGLPQSARKVKGTIHWVSAQHSLDAEVRLYDRLFRVEDPGGDNWREFINPDALRVLPNCKVEPMLRSTKPQERYQFERLAYFCVDDDSTAEHLVFNRTVTLRDTWAKIEKS
jgi:glutaminyl-tRNA synthetase